MPQHLVEWPQAPGSPGISGCRAPATGWRGARLIILVGFLLSFALSQVAALHCSTEWGFATASHPKHSWLEPQCPRDLGHASGAARSRLLWSQESPRPPAVEACLWYEDLGKAGAPGLEAGLC